MSQDYKSFTNQDKPKNFDMEKQNDMDHLMSIYKSRHLMNVMFLDENKESAHQTKQRYKNNVEKKVENNFFSGGSSYSSSDHSAMDLRKQMRVTCFRSFLRKCCYCCCKKYFQEF